MLSLNKLTGVAGLLEGPPHKLTIGDPAAQIRGVPRLLFSHGKQDLSNLTLIVRMCSGAG